MPLDLRRRSVALSPTSVRRACGRVALAVASIGAAFAAAPEFAFSQEATHRAEFADDRVPITTIRTVPVQETTYRQEWSTEMIETPVRRWVQVPAPAAAQSLAFAPLFGGPTVQWKLVEEKVRTPVTTSRIVPETRTVQKEIRMLSFEPGAKALASTAALAPISGANVVAGVGSPRVATAPNTTIPSTTVPAAPSSNAVPPAAPSSGLSPVGERGGFPSPTPSASPWVTPLQLVPSPTPWTAGTVGPNPQWGGLQRIDGDLPAGTLGAAGGLR